MMINGIGIGWYASPVLYIFPEHMGRGYAWEDYSSGLYGGDRDTYTHPLHHTCLTSYNVAKRLNTAEG